MVYIVAEVVVRTSAIFAIFVCGIVVSHYVRRTLPAQTLHFAEEATEMLSWVCEAFSFAYIGLTSVKFWLNGYKSVYLVVGYLVLIMAVRIFVVGALAAVLAVVAPGPSRLNA